VAEGNLDEGSRGPLFALSRFALHECWRDPINALGKPGDDLLSRALRHSTIGAGAFHGRVRDGIGCGRSARITRPTKGGDQSKSGLGLNTSVDASSIALNARAQVARSAVAQQEWALTMKAIKPIERLVLVSFVHCCTSTPSLSTWWSSTALKGELVLRWVSRLDAFSGYPFRTWLPCYAAGATTGPLEVRPSRSSRTRDRSSQFSYTCGR
jgi:hypothetical protein